MRDAPVGSLRSVDINPPNEIIDHRLSILGGEVMLLIRAIQTFIIAVILLVSYYWAPRVDGSIYPVLQNAVITDVETEIYNTITTTVITGRVDKVRDCNLISIAIYLGTFPDSFSNIRMDDMQATLEVQQPATDVTFGPYRIYAPVDILRLASFAIITYDCYDGFFWSTQSIVRIDNLINDYEMKRAKGVSRQSFQRVDRT